MKWTTAFIAASFSIAMASVWACGDDDAAAGPTCSKDDPSTPVDEAECKALATVASGQTALNTRGCPGCHGPDMAGQTSPLTGRDSYTKTLTGETVKLYPPNLTSDATGVGSWSDEDLAVAIRSGYDKDSLQLCPQMNHFSTMSDFEVYSIIMYLRSLPHVAKKVPRSICPPTKQADGQ